MHAERLADLVADREQRIERGHRVLQDHGDALAAHAAHLGIRLVEQVLALEHHPPADDARRRRQQAQDGQRKRALARARFADDAKCSPGVRVSVTSSTARTTRAPAGRRSGRRDFRATAAVATT
jgi:hypothetical protein